MEPLSFWDCNASFGRRAFRQPGSFTEKKELLDQMDRFGIERALVWHSLSREYDPAEGNRILLEECRDEERLMPVMGLLPHYTGEFPDPQETVRQMRAAGVRVAAVFPSVQGFGLSELTCGELFDLLEQYRIPLLLGLNECGGMEAFGRLAMARPKLRLVLTNASFRIDRELYPLLGKCDNVWIETSGYKPFCGLAEACRRFGAERFLFGSGMPVSSCASSVALLTYADLEEDDKRKIASENLKALLREVEL